MGWRIYYSTGFVDGESEADWLAAPSTDVQVVVLYEPPETVRWSYSGGVVRDRQLWTGDDEYDPFGWGEKLGKLIDDTHYFAIWEQACGDPRP